MAGTSCNHHSQFDNHWFKHFRLKKVHICMINVGFFGWGDYFPIFYDELSFDFDTALNPTLILCWLHISSSFCYLKDASKIAYNMHFLINVNVVYFHSLVSKDDINFVDVVYDNL